MKRDKNCFPISIIKNRVEQSISWDWSVKLLKVVVRVENLFNKTRYYWSLADLVLYNVSQKKKKTN